MEQPEWYLEMHDRKSSIRERYGGALYAKDADDAEEYFSWLVEYNLLYSDQTGYEARHIVSTNLLYYAGYLPESARYKILDLYGNIGHKKITSKPVNKVRKLIL